MRWLLALSVLALSACGGGGSDSGAKADAQIAAKVLAVGGSSVAVTALTVQSLTLKAERRVSRTVFDYDYQIVVKNNGAAQTGLVAQLTAVGAGTAIIDGTVAIGSLAAGATATPADIITLRHDRSLPFLPGGLVWQFSADPGTTGPLPGTPTDLAIDAITEYDADAGFPTAEVDLDVVRGVTILRSKVIFGFVPTATIGQVNAILQSLQATIVRSYAKSVVLEVRIPDPGSLSALETLITNLRAAPGVAFAMPMSFDPSNALPAILQTQAAPETDRLAHHLAVRGAQAWNARRAVALANLPLKPVLAIADYFGNGGVNAGLLNANLVAGTGSGFGTLVTSAHGYHVLGIAAGSFNQGPDAADSSSITGMYAAPQVLPLVIDDQTLVVQSCSTLPAVGNLCKAKTVEDRLRSILQAYQGVDRKIVVNTSLGYNGNGGLSEIESIARMWYWLILLRGGDGSKVSPLESQYLHTASAGNDAAIPAKRNIGWTRAAIEGALTNTAVVENRSADMVYPFELHCLHGTSSKGGNVSAVGSNTKPSYVDQGLWSYGDKAGLAIDRTGCKDKNGNAATCPMLGTSMAAPQVAGLAAYFWSIRSDVMPSELLDIIRMHATTEPVACSGGQPTIDAYATLLAADDAAALDRSHGQSRQGAGATGRAGRRRGQRVHLCRCDSVC
ncbi:MAG: S8 family serine peptidase [Rubrivivax sp.]